MVDIKIKLNYKENVDAKTIATFCKSLEGVKFGRNTILYASVKREKKQNMLTIRTMMTYKVARKIKVVHFTSFGDDVCPGMSEVVGVKEIKPKVTLKIYIGG